METYLIAEGTPLSHADVVSGFRALESVGVGKYVEGRRGWKSRFAFTEPVTAIVKLLDGETMTDSELETLELAASESSDSVHHTFVLRPDFLVAIELPTDVTEFEAKRLSKFIECLPFASQQN